eukprot:TRINITY_DN32792_c0_g1_i1.p1 TRINITY_DN32792_c0_g1~~TRINITY_DN32792_c0_g1_i1.p1  ORF type:complete len:717 (-),score=106.36 TRINITY_DN32792_c0_g1_i1:77-2134(-)
MASNPAPPPGGQQMLEVRVPVGAVAGTLIQIGAPDGTILQCQVPAGVRVGETFKIQYEVKIRPRLISEEDKFGGVAVGHLMPQYWTNVKVPGVTAFDEMIYLGRERHPVFDELFAETYFAKATRDRKCPKVTGTCPVTAGGCACVQPGGDPGLPVGYKVRRVVRVEDSEMWGRYERKRDRIRSQRTRKGQMPLPKLDQPVLTDEVANRHPDRFDPLDNTLNEVYLWHGTNVRTALAIAQDDFRMDMAGSNIGSMYGSGCYLAESITKADEYATDEPGGYYSGIFAVLLCRVVLGRFYYTQDRDEEAGSQVQQGNYDSTVGDRAKKVGTFREFVVYHSDEIYPEYIVLYSRIHASDSEQAKHQLEDTPFFMQLPVYWANCHKDPVKEMFHEQYLVRRHTQNLLQQLVDACFKGKGKVTVVGARRIENAKLWNSYVSFKRKLTMQLTGGASHISLSSGGKRKHFTQAHELDGNPDSGHTLTHLHMQDLDMEACLSVSNLDECLNETFLWHGTSKSAAEKIVQDDFHIPSGKDMKHAARFGNGAYFAEDFEKSLTYAYDAEDGKKCVLLCRVLCGDFYYTEAHTQIDANQRRASDGKHCVLANPEGKGPREFVMPDIAQVYPEYVLDLKVADWVAPPPAMMMKTTVQIQVPAGVSAGQTVRMRIPDGREMDVAIPEGAVAGTTLQLSV